jgi:hypothetical protein
MKILRPLINLELRRFEMFFTTGKMLYKILMLHFQRSLFLPLLINSSFEAENFLLQLRNSLDNVLILV